MNSSITERIFQQHTKEKDIKVGSILFADVDLAVGTDATMPLAIKEFKATGKKVFNPEQIALVQDHFVPAKDIASANHSQEMRIFAREENIRNYFELGRGGICHHIVPDSGLCYPGDLIVGADSHTCTYGAFGAFATGVGSTDLAAVMATGKLWFRVPQAIKVVLYGRKREYVQGKDIILKLISMLGVDGATYKALEFTGEGLTDLDMSDRITICNMAIEAGGKTGIFEVDDVTIEYFERFQNKRMVQILKTGDDSAYEQVIGLDISLIEPLVAEPFLPSKVRPASEFKSLIIDQAVLGSCTNGRLEDMRMAARVLKGRHVHPGVRLIVIPGTQEILKSMIEEGLLNIFIDAGAMISPPTCGPCLGGHMGILGDNEVCISSSNRNFVGRMGSTSSKVYLANPAIVAASAVHGAICHPEVFS